VSFFLNFFFKVRIIFARDLVFELNGQKFQSYELMDAYRFETNFIHPLKM